jgi:uncharacterized protein (TIGR03437 family)
VSKSTHRRIGESASTAFAAAIIPALLLPSIGLAQAAAAQVSVSSQVSTPGSSVILPIVFQSNDEDVSGLQFDIQYDNSAMSLFANLGDAAKNSGKVLNQVELAPNTRRFLIVGLNSNPIASGTVISLFANLSPNAPVGLFPLTVSSVAGTASAGLPASLIGADGAVTIAGSTTHNTPLQVDGVLNGASLAPGPLAPGEIFTLIGSSIGSMNTATGVSFDGVPAVLFYASINQINGVTPYELAGRTTTRMEITTGGQVVSDLALPASPESPAIFTLDSSGVGQGAILNQDATLNSPLNPAASGTIVALFATGAGQTNPAGVDGKIAGTTPITPVLPVGVQIAGVAAEVLYAGVAPGLSTGVLQVNCRVPASVTPGYSVSIVLTVGTASSAQNVTLAVQ